MKTISLLMITVLSLCFSLGCSGDEGGIRDQTGKFDNASITEKINKYKKDSITLIAYPDIVAYGDQAVQPLLDAYIDSVGKDKKNFDEYYRINLIWTLREIKTPAAMKALGKIALLKEVDKPLQKYAIQALTRIGSPEAASVLTTLYSSVAKKLKEDVFSGFETIIREHRSGESVVVETIMTISINPSEEKGYRLRAARALGETDETHSGKVEKTLIEALNDTDMSVRTVAVRALGKIGSERSVEGLEEAMNLCEDSSLAREVVRALGTIARNGSTEAEDAMIKGLNFGKKYVRQSAAEELGKIGTAKARDALRQVVDDENRTVRFYAVRGLKDGTPETREVLSHTSKTSKNVQARMNAVGGLAGDGSPEAVNELIQILKNDPDSNVRSKALSALKSTAGDRLFEVVGIALKDEYYSICVDSVHILATLESNEAFSLLVETLDHKNPMVTDAVIWNLSKNGSSEAIEALAQFARESAANPNSRSTVIKALEKATDSDIALHALIYILKSGVHPGLRRSAAWSLSFFDSFGAETALIEAATTDSSSPVRGGACSALSKFDSHSAIEAIFEAFEDENNRVRGYAVKAMLDHAKKDDAVARRAIDAVVTMYKETEDISLRQDIYYFLDRLQTPESKAAIESIK